MSSTLELVILSSSPYQQPARRSCSPICSSPILTSPRILFNSNRSRPTLKTGSRAAPIAPGTVTGFRTASLLVKENQLSLETHEFEEIPQKKAVKRSKNPNATAERQPKSKKSRKRKEASVEDGLLCGCPDELRGKPLGRLKKINKSFHEKKDAAANSFPAQTQLANLAVVKANVQPSETCDEPGVNSMVALAQKRRIDWTPPRDTQSSRNSDDFEKLAVFKGLHGAFGYNPHNAPVSASAPELSSHDGVISKRRRVEVVESSISVVSDKLPSIRTKSETANSGLATSIPVTEQSASKNVTPSTDKVFTEGRSDINPDSIQKSLEEPIPKCKKAPKRSRTITSIAIAQYNGPPEKGLASSTIGNADETTRSRKGKKQIKKGKPMKTPPRKLLSPGSARHKLTKQNYLFCTSSQMPEDSTYIEDLQLAMKVSEKEIEFEPIDEVESRLTKSKLWSAASRDDDDLYLPSSQLKLKEHRETLMDTKTSDVDIMPNESPDLHSTMVSPIDEAGPLATVTVEHTPKPSLQIPRSSVAISSFPSTHGPVTPKKARGRPRKQLFAAATTLQQSDSKIQISPRFAVIDEIEDSEPELTPSPPHHTSPATSLQLEPLDSKRKQAKTKHKGQRVAGDPTDDEALRAKIAKEAAVQALLFPLISAAVKASPRTRNPSEPSWYEKMLLYDPIVLEDLTTWLKEDGRLEVVGEAPQQIELDEKLVQKWCWANSICCMWREGWRGGVRKVY